MLRSPTAKTERASITKFNDFSGVLLLLIRINIFKRYNELAASKSIITFFRFPGIYTINNRRANWEVSFPLDQNLS